MAIVLLQIAKATYQSNHSCLTKFFHLGKYLGCVSIQKLGIFLLIGWVDVAIIQAFVSEDFTGRGNLRKVKVGFAESTSAKAGTDNDIFVPRHLRGQRES